MAKKSAEKTMKVLKDIGMAGKMVPVGIKVGQTVLKIVGAAIVDGKPTEHVITFPGKARFDDKMGKVELTNPPKGRDVMAHHTVGDFIMIPDGSTELYFPVTTDVRVSIQYDREFVSITQVPESMAHLFKKHE
jgi:hypothetical protein